MIATLLAFFPALLSGFAVNLQIAAGATLVGLLVGLPLAGMQHAWPRSTHIIRPCIRLMQAAPVYAVMFFVLAALPRDLMLLDIPITAFAAVTLSQSVYLSSYIAESGYDLLAAEDQPGDERVWLFVSSVLRGFLVVVMSSGFGAAVGLSEAVSVTMRQAERLHVLSDRVLLFLVVIAFFAIIFGTANAVLVRFTRRHQIRARLSAAHSPKAEQQQA